MKLLFVHQKLGDYGGAEANICLTAGELARRGHVLEFAYREPTGKNEHAWHDLFQKTTPLLDPDPTIQLRRLLSRFEPDVIYLHSLADLPVLEELALSGIPVVRMVHDHEMYCLRGYKYNVLTRKPCDRAASLACVFPCLAMLGRNRGGTFPIAWKSFLQKKREIAINRRFRHFIVYSEYSRAQLVKNGFPVDCISVHVPMDCSADLPVSSFSDRNLVLSAGQIIRGKGVDVLLKALARVQTPFECAIVGEGSHRPRCERLARRLGLQQRVKFEGYVPRAELKHFYLDATAFLVSSLWPEPFGMVGPEAMRHGLPVVGFDAGGVGEWLHNHENGFLVPWGDVTAYAQRIDTLLRDKALARSLGANGRERVNRVYEVSRQVTLLERILFVVQNARPSIPTHHCAEVTAV